MSATGRYWATVAGAVLAVVAAGCTGGAQMRKLHPSTSTDAAQEAGSSALDGGARPDGSATPDGGAADHPTAGTGAIGTSCTGNTQCASGFCADGVCCNEACDGVCRTCASTETLGTCIPADIGTDPHENCEDQGVAGCGTDGVCDGSGACEKYSAGVICQSAGCTGSTLTFAQRCDGRGVCQAAESQPCAPFVCGSSGQCKTTCTTDADCVAPNTCMNGSCGKVPIGAGCSSDDQCNTGVCAQGVCCASACTGTCVSCDLAGSIGKCVDVPAGQSSLIQCLDQGSPTCKLDGLCDGKGSCQQYASGTACAAATCSGSTFQPASTCTGTGTCLTPATRSCAPYSCGAGACKKTCASNTDCAAPASVCSGTHCVVAASLSVKTHTLNGSNLQWIYFDIQITNTGTSTVALSQLTARYWYTYDTPPAVGAQVASCTYANGVTGSCASTTLGSASNFVAVTPAKTDADFYFTFGFTSAAGNLAAGATVELGPGFHKSDFSNYSQTNDYSYNAATAFMATIKVTLYLGGVLIYGSEPS